MARKPPVYFFSASHQQSAYWANQLGFERQEWHHIGPGALHGRSGATIYLAGRYWERPDYYEFLTAIAPTGSTLIIADDMVPRAY